MKLGRRHLIASVGVLAASIAWNVWVFTQPTPGSGRSTTQQQEPLLQASGGGPVPSAPVDPSAIPQPPAVDTAREPVFARNPFASGTRVDPAPAAVMSTEAPAAAPEPVLGAILFSSDRRSAVIDGRIVGVGDRVAGGVVVSIARDAVVVRRDSGEELRLEARTGIRREFPE